MTSVAAEPEVKLNLQGKPIPTNINGDPICHGKGCRKHKGLTESFGGLFCSGCLIKIRAVYEQESQKPNPELPKPDETGKLDLNPFPFGPVNRNGDAICHGKGCRKHK